jgi:glycosyltransferase involved in cell wall biosynthesis
VQPDISVIIPAYEEKSRIAPTVQSIARARSSGARVEFVIVDDASTDGTVANLVSALPWLLEEPNIDIRVESLDTHSGNYHARNRGAEAASADLLFMTDGHVQFSHGWDDLVLRKSRPDRILSATTVQKGTGFRGYGCSLLVPRMGTTWNPEPAQPTAAVQIVPCHATVVPRDLFLALGGYDTGMILYGGGVPEFSLRAWLHGAEIYTVKGLEVEHHFKTRDQFTQFLYTIREYWVHNCLRLALLYLREERYTQVLEFYSQHFPGEYDAAMALVNDSDVWERRSWLEASQRRSFDWFAGYFGITDEAGVEIA